MTATMTTHVPPSIPPKEVRDAQKAALVEVIEAMRSVQTETDRWQLASRLLKMVPTGTGGFDRVIDAATAEHVDGGFSATTLRLYRDTAARWSVDQRVPNVSFSAHREVMVLPSIAEGRKLLESLATANGASKVTIQQIRKAVAVKQRKVPAAAAPAASTVSPTVSSALKDLKAGGPELIAAIGPDTSAEDLDTLQAGLSKVTAHVEALRAKAARKAAQAAKRGPQVTDPKTAIAVVKSIKASLGEPKPAAGAAEKTAPKTAKIGDLRGL